MKKILLVCMGNICRSPMAQVVANKSAAAAGLSVKFAFYSAGTHAHHAGERPDPRAEGALKRRGYEVGRLRSRRMSRADFDQFDLILAMDHDNLTELRRMCPPELTHKLGLFLACAEETPDAEVPDPYYGNIEGFERVLDLCEAGAKGLMRRLAGTEPLSTLFTPR